MSNQILKYHRVLLKLSGEMLEDEQLNFSPHVAKVLANEVKQIYVMGAHIAIVVGGGNIFRGVSGSKQGLDPVTADYMGMHGTIINALGLMDIFEKSGMPTRVQSAFESDRVCEPVIRRRALRHLEKDRVVIYAAGTGNPGFTTDTAAALRAFEIGAEVLLKGTKVDGVYDCDPVHNPAAKRFESISCNEVIERKLQVMDSTAFTFCRDKKIPIIVFNLFTPGNLKAILEGKSVGTLVTVEP